MSNFRKWSRTATANASIAGGANTINFSEGQLPGTVNNSAREMMAQLRSIYEPSEWGWVEFSATASVASQTTFKIAGDQTANWTANRRWRLKSASTTRYGTIVSSSYTAETTVTVTVDSGSLSASHTLAALAAIDSNHIPANTYVTSASLVTALGGYLSSASAATTLATYVTSNSMSAAIANYVTSNSASAMIATQIAAASVASMTLISTLTTTSGTTQTSAQIGSSYRALYMELEGVSFTGNATLTLAASDDNGSNFGSAVNVSATTGSSSGAVSGSIWIDNIQSTGTDAAIVRPTTSIVGGTMFTTAVQINTSGGTGGPIDKIRFAGGTFDAGTIRIYGVK